MRRILLPALAAAALVGCGTIESETAINADGSFDRTVSLAIPAMDMMGTGNTPNPAEMVSFGGAESWQMEEGMEGENVTLVATRSFGAGESIPFDYQLMAGEAPYVKCEVDVKRLANGHLEYTETYTYVGPPEEDKKDMSEFTDVLGPHVKALGGGDDAVARVGESLSKRFWRILFGPNDPLMADMIASMGAAERKATMLMSEAMFESLKDEFPNKPEEELIASTKEIIKDMPMESAMKSEVPEPDVPMGMPGEEEEEDDGSPDMATISVVVSGPGKLVETNGNYDRFSGEIFWTMYGQAPMMEPVVLKAVFDPSE